MSWHDWMSVAEGAYDTTVNGVSSLALHAVPGIGRVMSASDALGEASASIYDATHGDRDGAIGHGAQAVMHAGGALIPGAGDAIDVANLGVGVAGTTARLGAAVTNNIAGETVIEPDEIPTNAGDLISQVAVGATHAIHGPQQSRGTGTEQGETRARNIGTIPAIGPGGAAGAEVRDGLARLLGGGTSTERGSTSGNNRTQGSRAGDWIHERLNGAPVRNRAQH